MAFSSEVEPGSRERKRVKQKEDEVTGRAVLLQDNAP
jgi:hypothetical protein